MGDEPCIYWPEILRFGEIVKNSLSHMNRIRIDGSEEYQVLNDHVLFSLWGKANYGRHVATMKGKLKQAGWDNAFLAKLLAQFAHPQMR